ncbi:Cupin domain protein [Caballeronia fortuita]|uniref:Cupin domain protein n=1 Tax=Caballeronia fortuita TaxID=1777138 RepID=A0A158AW44_9BURK|nr:cupin domain-containing protein [Caballeronia fortuita]SAK61247.1 Cupin domain protein [Caballeronia fortuita]
MPLHEQTERADTRVFRDANAPVDYCGKGQIQMNDEDIPLANQKVVYKILLTTDDYAVAQTTVAPGGETQWHHHTHVKDRFLVVKGVLTVETRIAGRTVSRQVRDHYTVEPGVVHHVKNETAGDVVYIMVQSGGASDIVLA